MIDVFEAENEFYRQCDPGRLGKFLAHAKLYELSVNLPGDFAEVGVFKGASFSRFRKLASLFHPDYTRKFFGFDVFGPFPDSDWEADSKMLTELRELDGSTSIGKAELEAILEAQGLADNVSLIEGDVTKTLPKFFAENPYSAFSIVNIDLDLYGPTKLALEFLYPRVVKGGVVILDDYAGGFPGANRAVEEYLQEQNLDVKIQKFPYTLTPSFIVKQ